jgi:hypothetical protein
MKGASLGDAVDSSTPRAVGNSLKDVIFADTSQTSCEPVGNV